MTGQMGVPVILVDGQVIIGFDRPRLESLLAKNGSGQRPHLGAKVIDASKMARRHGGVPVFGAFVGAVAPSSLAEKAGIKKGDIITEINLRRISSADDLERGLANLSPGDRATIAFLRGQQALRSEIMA